MREPEAPPPPDRFRVGDRWRDPKGVIRLAEQWGYEGVCMRATGATGVERWFSHAISVRGWSRISWGGQA